MAIPAIGGHRSIVMAPVTKLGLVRMAIQAGIGKAHVEFLPFTVHINSIGIPDYDMSPFIQKLHVLRFHVIG
jgi:hypothetical protein